MPETPYMPPPKNKSPRSFPGEDQPTAGTKYILEPPAVVPPPAPNDVSLFGKNVWKLKSVRLPINAMPAGLVMDVLASYGAAVVAPPMPCWYAPIAES